MRSFLYSPRIDDPTDLYHQAVRVAWYFSYLEDCSFTFVSDLPLEDLQPARYIDTTVAERIDELVACGRLRVQSALSEEGGQWQGVVAWRGIDAAKAALPPCLAAAVEAGDIAVYNVDREHRMEGSLYIDVGNAICPGVPDVARYERRFAELAQRSKRDNAFLFCTGPSVSQYAAFDYSNGLSIICNSVIFDEALLAHAKPEILVFADPIFHFGASSYAQEFRVQLKKVCARYPMSLVVPIKYVNMFLASMPELEDRLIGVPYRKDLDINLDLASGFEVRTSDNILSFLMIPVAASLAENLFLLGCDGRKLEDNTYFWAHNEKTQISSEMENIQKAHPSFFKLDYDEYYLRHCQNVAEYAQALEASGKSLTSVTPSYIEALADRRFPYDVDGDRLVVSINPDLKDDFGHFYHYDVRVGENLPPSDRLVVWANSQADVAGSQMQILPTFRRNSFQIRSRIKQDVSDSFRSELIGQLQRLSLLREQKTLYMYTCDLSHAEIVLELAESMPALFRDVQVHMNLFFMHFDVAVDTKTIGRKRAYQEALLRAQELPDRTLTLYVDAQRLRALADERIGPGFLLWPMINVSSVAGFRAAANAAAPAGGAVTRVFCPATGQVAKGYDFACNVVKQVNASGFADEFHFVLRNLLRDTKEINVGLSDLQNEIAAYPNVEFLDGTVSEADYANEYAAADVVLIPYRREDFYSRTSAAVVDALYFNKPIVCASDTWLEEQAQRFGVAHGFVDGDVADCVAAIRSAAANAGGVGRSEAVEDLWSATYSAGNLVGLFEGHVA